jgi:hypothetical protein
MPGRVNLPQARRAALAALGALLLAGCAGTPPWSAAPSTPPPPPDRKPELATFSAQLQGRHAVPPSQSAGQGRLVAVLNRSTGLLRWKLSFSGLSGPVQNAAFHSPGMEGEVAPAVLRMGRTVLSPSEGRAILTARQRSDLLAGQWYVNLPTARYPGGELRGQLIERR